MTRKEAQDKYMAKVKSDPELLIKYKNSRIKSNHKYYMKNRDEHYCNTQNWFDEHPEKKEEYKEKNRQKQKEKRAKAKRDKIAGLDLKV